MVPLRRDALRVRADPVDVQQAEHVPGRDDDDEAGRRDGVLVGDVLGEDHRPGGQTAQPLGRLHRAGDALVERRLRAGPRCGLVGLERGGDPARPVGHDLAGHLDLRLGRVLRGPSLAQPGRLQPVDPGEVGGVDRLGVAAGDERAHAQTGALGRRLLLPHQPDVGAGQLRGGQRPADQGRGVRRRGRRGAARRGGRGHHRGRRRRRVLGRVGAGGAAGQPGGDHDGAQEADEGDDGLARGHELLTAVAGGGSSRPGRPHGPRRPAGWTLSTVPADLWGSPGRRPAAPSMRAWQLGPARSASVSCPASSAHGRCVEAAARSGPGCGGCPRGRGTSGSRP